MMNFISKVRTECRKIKGMKGKVRRNYIWDYYKLPIGVAIFALCILLPVIIFSVQPRPSLNVVVINAVGSGQDANTLFDGLVERAGYDAAQFSADVNCEYALNLSDYTVDDAYTMQALATLFGMGDIDLFAAEQQIFNAYAEKDAFVDLSTLFPQSVLERFGDSLYTYEKADGTSVVIGFIIGENSVLTQNGICGRGYVAGIPETGQNRELAADVLALVP